MANFSEEQIADLMLMRRMCIIRRGQLANQMKAQVSLLPIECFTDMHMPHPTDSIIKMHSMARFIRDNGSEDFRIWGATLCACMRGVSYSAHCLC